jgi:hypothetical protein
MTRRSPALTRSGAPVPLHLSDAEIVTEGDGAAPTARIDGASIAALLDVEADVERLLDPEAISLDIERVADLLGALAERGQAPTAGALSLAEQCLRRLAARVDGLRPGARLRSRRFVVARGVREVPRRYRACLRVHVCDPAHRDHAPGALAARL